MTLVPSYSETRLPLPDKNDLSEASLVTFPFFYDRFHKAVRDQKMGVPGALQNTARVAPAAFAAVGVQLAAQKLIGKSSNKCPDEKDSPSKSPLDTVAAAAASAAPLTLLQGLSRGKTVRESAKDVTIKKVVPTFAGQAGFQLSMLASEPLNKRVKQSYGDNRPLEHGVQFLTGAVGGLLYPSSNGLSKGLRQAIHASPSRAVVFGASSVAYRLAMDALDNKDGDE